MKRRLFYPALLVLASLVSAAALTAVTAKTLASISKDNKSNTTIEQQLTPVDHSTVRK
jgi:hypothetical protein